MVESFKMDNNLVVGDKGLSIMPKPGPEKKELKKRKTPFSKTFINPDGSFSIEVSDKPVNFKNKSGNWQSINNSLVSKSSTGYIYENDANSIIIRFAANNMGGKLVYYGLDDKHWIEFSPTEKFSQTGTPKDSSIYYKNIRQNVDLEYVLDGVSLKENIILYPYPSSNSFSFDINYSGIFFEKQGDGSILALDSETNEALFTLNKPVAIDNNGNTTDRVSMTIVRDLQRERLVVTVNYDWLMNAAFPVIIDPQIDAIVQYDENDKTKVKNVIDTFLSSGRPGVSYLGGYPNIHVGYLDDQGYNITRSLIKFNFMPALPPGAKITSATLSLYQWLGEVQNSLNVYRITSDWAENTANWENQPSYDAANPIVTNFTAAPQSTWNINITNDVTGWYTGTRANYGFFLKATNENNPRLGFYSSNSAVSPPRITINYNIDALGIEPFFPYYGNVNVHNGNLVLSDVDVTLPGRGIPIIFNRTYNSRGVATTTVGDRWRHNLHTNIQYVGSNPVQFVYLTEADGTTKMFTLNNEYDPLSINIKYNSPPGVHDKLYRSNGTFILEEKSGIKYHFNAAGQIAKIVDTNNNTTTMAYVSGEISTITDPSGRTVSFSYIGGKLDKIQGSSITTVKYEYSGNYLQKVKKLDSSGNTLTELTYGYDTYNNIKTVTDMEGKTVEYIYSFPPGLGLRIAEINRSLTIGNALTPSTIQTRFQYEPLDSNIKTTITLPKQNKLIYQINSNGNVQSIATGESGENITKYQWDEVNKLTSITSPNGNISGADATKFTTQFEYDDSGNLTRAINPLGHSTQYYYTVNDDPSEIVNALGISTSNTYSSERNLKTSSTSIFSTIALEYDSYGNVLSQTDPIGIAANLVRDSGFEDAKYGTPLTYWTILSGSVSYVQTNKVNGYYSAQLIAASGQASLRSASIPVTEYITYNVSWFVKTLNAGSTNGGATAIIEWLNASSNVIATTSPLAVTIGTTNGFVRKGARSKAPQNAASARIILMLTSPASQQATSWFDNIQFEYIPAINNYNLIFNGDFEYDVNDNNQPDGWNVPTSSAAQGILDAENYYTGTRSYKIIGASNYKYINQFRQMYGGAGVPFMVSCWTKATGTQNPSGAYSLVLQFLKFNKTTQNTDIIGEFTKSINKTTDNAWQYIELFANSPSDFDKLAVYCTTSNQTGLTMWFDNVKLRLNASPAAVMSSYNLLENGSFETETGTNINDFNDWTVSKDASVAASKLSTLMYDGNVLPFSGNRMIKMVDVPSWATLINTAVEPIDISNKKSYTASVMIRTINAGGAGAVIKFNISSASTYLGQIYSKPVTGTTDWSRVTVTTTTDEILSRFPGAKTLTVAIGTIAAASGTMYFDAARLSEGSDKILFQYESSNNYVNKITDQNGNETNFENDNRGNITKITDAKAYPYNIAYDKLDRVKYTMNPQNLRSDYVYYTNGTLKQIDNQIVDGTPVYKNTTINLTYNELNQPKLISEANWLPITLEYDANSNLSHLSFPNGKGVKYAYDASDRIVLKEYDNDAVAKWSYEYDANSNIKNVKKSGTEVAVYEFDPLDRVTSENISAIVHLYGYNPSGQLETLTHKILPGTEAQQSTSYKYDLGGFNSDINGPNATASSFMYDEESRLKKSYVAITGAFYLTYREYDSLNRLSRLMIENKEGTPVYDYSYRYDTNGNRVEDTDNLGSKRVVYGYDEINQLTTEQYYTGATLTRKYDYSYDKLGNRLSVTPLSGSPVVSVYNSINEIQTYGTNSQYTHDLYGNIIKAGSAEFIYNDENQLIQFKYAGSVAATYEYNWQGLRSKKVTPAKTELYYYTGNKLSYITDGTKKLKYYFVRDLSGKLLQMIDYTGATPKAYIYILDIHGNVIGLSDDTAILVNYEYDAWGNIINIPQSAPVTGNGEPLVSANPFRYCGYQFDGETGFYYLKYRYYYPVIGRFLTKDPMMSYNRYMYCKNNPVNFVDPLGLIQLGLGENDEILQAFPSGNVRNKQTGKVVKTKPVGQQLIEEGLKGLSDAYDYEPTQSEKTIVFAIMGVLTLPVHWGIAAYLLGLDIYFYHTSYDINADLARVPKTVPQQYLIDTGNALNVYENIRDSVASSLNKLSNQYDKIMSELNSNPYIINSQNDVKNTPIYKIYGN